MEILVFLIPAAWFLGGLGLCAFLWALTNGQYSDIDGAELRILSDDDQRDGVQRAVTPKQAPCATVDKIDAPQGAGAARA